MRIMKKILNKAFISFVCILNFVQASDDIVEEENQYIPPFNGLASFFSKDKFYFGISAGADINRIKTNTTEHTYALNEYGYSNNALNATSAAIATSHKVMGKNNDCFLTLFLGYCFDVYVAKLGFEFETGMYFSNNKLKSKKSDDEYACSRNFAKFRKRYFIALTPTIGYMFSKWCEGYVKVGMKLLQSTYETYKSGDARRCGSEFFDATAKAPKTIPDNKFNETVKQRSKMLIPVLGCGLKCHATDKLFVKIEYLYEFKKNVKLPKNGIIEVTKASMDSQTFKLGIGYKIF